MLVQCFPIPPQGGRMKIRLGVTSPLMSLSASQASYRPPCLLARNYALAKGLQHALVCESVGMIRSDSKTLSRRKTSSGGSRRSASPSPPSSNR